MDRKALWLTVAAILGFLPAFRAPAEQPTVGVHYLGHAAFVFRFPTGLTVLTDYGESRAYGLDSPVFSLGALRPDVVTLSHDHADHAAGTLPERVGTVMRGEGSLEAKGVRISPIPTFEGSLDAPDNFSFLFEHAGMKILHLGDCQALILGVGDPGIRERIRQMYPDTYDLVLLPVGFVHDILSEAAELIVLLDARRVVPMHYWSPGDRDSFLDRMEGRVDARGRAYQVRALPGPSLELRPEENREAPPEVVGLTPGPIPFPTGPSLGEPPPGRHPSLFAPGLVSSIHWEPSAPAVRRWPGIISIAAPESPSMDTHHAPGLRLPAEVDDEEAAVDLRTLGLERWLPPGGADADS